MEVILLENVSNLGRLGDKVKVKSGFGRNFLVPYGKAVPATEANLAEFEARRAELEKAAAESKAAAEARAEVLNEAEATITAKVGDEGKLFGSIGTKEIADAFSSDAVTIEKSEVRLPEGVLRNVGDFEIALQLHSEVSVTVKLAIVGEE